MDESASKCSLRTRRYRSRARLVWRSKGQARGRRPLPSTSATSWSKSTSSTRRPIHSPRRMPVEASRRMMAVSRRSSNDVPAQAASRRSSSSVRSTGRRLVGNGGRAHARHRRVADLVLAGQPAKDLLERPIAVGHRRRPVAGVRQRDQKGLDVLAADGGHVGRHTLLYQEGIELVERLHVGRHRGGGKILCSKMAREGADRIGQVEVRVSVGRCLVGI